MTTASARPLRRAAWLLGLLAGCLMGLASIAPSSGMAAPAGPAWSLSSTAYPTNFVPGDSSGNDTYLITATNVGDAPTDGSSVILTDVLPDGMTPTGINFFTSTTGVTDLGSLLCPSKTECSYPGILAKSLPAVAPGGWLEMVVHVANTLSTGASATNVATITGGGAAAASASEPTAISATPASYGIQSASAELVNADGTADTQAGSHPYAYTTSFTLTTKLGPQQSNGSSYPVPVANPHNIDVELPPGLIGNPQNIPQCTSAELDTNTGAGPTCPVSSQVGIATVFSALSTRLPGTTTTTAPVYNVAPPPGVPAEFGFQVQNDPVVLEASVRTGGDYGVTVSSIHTSQAVALSGVSATFWGVPADPSHDPQRGLICKSTGSCSGGGQSSDVSVVQPLLTLPTSCAGPQTMTISTDSWQAQGQYVSGSAALPATTGCGALAFSPSLRVQPTTSSADSPSGLRVDLSIPQDGLSNPSGLAEADLKDVTMTLPEGMVVNPSSASGLGSCSEVQIELDGPDPASCPDDSKIGTVEIDTPLLSHVLKGGVYLAQQRQNKFGSLLALYIAAYNPETGVVVKLAGRVTPDPRTGQLTTTFDENPQLPFKHLHLELFGGPRAALRTPTSCGTYTTTATLTPWSSGRAAQLTDSFQVDGCGDSTFDPKLSAGTASPLAGTYSPFTLRLTREDGSPELGRLSATLPKGLLGSLAGVPYCPDSTLAAISEAEGTGAAQVAHPSCPEASQIGTVTVGAGAGPTPFYDQLGDAYLAGPYEGAALSLAVVTPAVAGPFDLGTVVVRNALKVDPFSSQVTAVSDPLPRILHGIPLDLRDIRVELDRPNFILNPTDCGPMAIAATITSTQGQTANPSNHFQVGGCRGLTFKPRLKVSLKGATKRIGHPALKAVLTAKPGEANIGRAQVNLPHAEFLDQSNLNKTCTKPVLLAGECPASAVYGHAKAWTPLLERPLEGPVYLVGGFGYKLPALVAELNGQIKILLVGKVDSGKNKGIRNTFEVVPDAPVSRFVLEMKGGKKYGLLENSENLCKVSKDKRRAIVRFTGQNGKVDNYKPVVANQCGKVGKKGHAKHNHRGGKQG